MAELRNRGIPTDDEPGQEDFGWYFNFNVAGERHCFVVSFQPNDISVGDCWHGWVERDTGFLASVFGSRRLRDINLDAIQVIADIFASSSQITQISWGEAALTRDE